MVKITVPADCDNAPKRRFIKDFCVANVHGDIKTVMDMLTDDICLEIPGYKTVQGQEAVERLLTEDAKRSKVTELAFENIVSHGDRVAANGILKFEDGGSVAFCNMYTFNSHSKHAKIKLIKTYSIVLH